MGKIISPKCVIIVGIIFVLVLMLIFGWFFVKSQIDSIVTSIVLNDIAKKINLYIQNNSPLPPNLEAVGYKSDGGRVILEYYREPKVWHGLKVIALTKHPVLYFNKKRYGLVLEDGQVYTQDVAPFTKPLRRSTEAIVIRKLIQDGIPEAGAHLLEWLNYEISKSQDKKDSSNLEWIIKGIGLYRIKEGIETLKSIYMKNHTYAPIVIQAIVKIDDPSQVPFLLECLRDETIDWQTRCEVAGALIVYGEDEGRVFLLKQYEIYLQDISTKSGWDQTSRDVLENIYDEKLIQEIDKLRNNDYSSTAMNNISTLIARMEINTWDIDKLLDMAQETDSSKSAYKLYPAIRCLGQKAGPEVILILNNLPRLMVNSEAAREAIKDIKRRNWKSLSQN